MKSPGVPGSATVRSGRLAVPTTQPGLRAASDLAAATARIAHRGVGHGDNAPDRTDELKARVAAVDVLVPKVEPPTRDRPMCWAWGDHVETAIAREVRRRETENGGP